MEKDFPFVEVPEELLPIVGEPDPGTRIHRASGPEEAAGPWHEVVTAVLGACLSPGGAGMYAPVTRAAVHRRLKEGKLTAFCFHVTSTRVGLFGKAREVRSSPYIYIPSSEVKAWGAELEERIIRLGRITREELEGRRPDWQGEFWQWHSKWRQEQFKKVGKRIEK